MARRRLQDARALVTGASSGIGREIALELAARGARVAVTARRRERLEQVVDGIAQGGGEAWSFAGDLTDDGFRHRLLEAIQLRFGGLDVLVNNAGIGALGPFATADPSRLRAVMEVNFFAPAELIRGALPLLQAGTRPIVVNIGSVLGHRAMPLKSEYCASKFALHGLSDALRAELADEGIDLLLVSPSTTDTEFFDAVIDRQAEPPSRTLPAASPRSVARRTVRAIARGRHEIILTGGGKLLVWLDRLCPPLMNRLAARFGK